MECQRGRPKCDSVCLLWAGTRGVWTTSCLHPVCKMPYFLVRNYFFLTAQSCGAVPRPHPPELKLVWGSRAWCAHCMLPSSAGTLELASWFVCLPSTFVTSTASLSNASMTFWIIPQSPAAPSMVHRPAGLALPGAGEKCGTSRLPGPGQNLPSDKTLGDSWARVSGGVPVCTFPHPPATASLMLLPLTLTTTGDLENAFRTLQEAQGWPCFPRRASLPEASSAQGISDTLN